MLDGEGYGSPTPYVYVANFSTASGDETLYSFDGPFNRVIGNLGAYDEDKFVVPH
jgi:hypothetical protein